MNFLYEAVDDTGLPVFGKIDASDAAEAEALLVSKGLRVQTLAPSRGYNEVPGYLPPVGGSALMTAPSAEPTLLTVPTQMDRVNASPVMQELTSIGTVNAIRRNVPLSQEAEAEAVNRTPRTVNIKLAGNAARVDAQARRSNGLPPLVKGASPEVSMGSPLAGVKTKELLLFFQQFASLVHSGITLYGALDNLAPRTRNVNLAKVIRDMADAARGGKLVSDVMAGYPRIFEEHIVGLMRAGEHAGFIEIALAEIAETYQATIKFKRNSWIPKSMAIQSLFLLLLVIPLFPTLFSSLDFQANILRYFALVLTVSLPVSFAVLGAVALGFRTLQLPKYRHLRDTWSLKIPAYGALQRENAICTFLRVLRRLYASGVSPVYAWEGAMNTAVNVVIREQLKQSYALMQSGASLGDAFLATGLFADQVQQMVITGQQSGQVVEMLDQASVIYEQRVHEATGKARFMMLRLGMMAMLILGGGAVIWMAKSYFAGVFHIAESIENGN